MSNLKMTHIDCKSNRPDFSKREWIKLINSVSGFKSAHLLGTISQEKKTNLSIISSLFHLGAEPAILGFVVRPHSDQSPRHSYMNIIESNYYTINHVHKNFYKQAHQTSARYPRETSEFVAVGLSEEFKDSFIAPYVLGSNVQIGLKFLEQIDVKKNNTIIVIGEVEKIYLAEGQQFEDGHIHPEGSVVVAGLDHYFETNSLSRLTYAKPDKILTELEVPFKV